MRRRVHQNNEQSDIDLTPMLDVVFIMLIFFIVTTSFVKESGLEINRPNAKSATTKAAANIFVAIKDESEIWIDKRLVDLRAVRANIERLKVDKPKASVVIQADKASQTGLLIGVMDQIRLAGISDISVAASKE